jgi:hypothetical protein
MERPDCGSWEEAERQFQPFHRAFRALARTGAPRTCPTSGAGFRIVSGERRFGKARFGRAVLLHAGHMRIVYKTQMQMLRFLAPLALILAFGSAQAADVDSTLVVQAPPVAAATACSRASVLRRIEVRFAYAERRTWHRGFTIRSIGNPRPSHHPYAEPGLVKREYCMADGVMTNGDTNVIFYTVEHKVGFVGIGTYVDFCVLGLDPWHVHDGECRTVR